jgi:hypothetical protein
VSIATARPLPFEAVGAPASALSRREATLRSAATTYLSGIALV